MRATLSYSWRAFGLMLITMVAVVVVGIVDGVALAILISFMDRARRTARPELLRLGPAPSGQWLPLLDPRTDVLSGVVAFRLNGPLWFGNATWFQHDLINAIPEGRRKPDVLILDATRIDDIDFTGADALLQVAQVCTLRDVNFAIATHMGRTEEAFERRGIVDALGEGRFFDSVEQAVQQLAPNR
jgi:MFS superfamily sulfate permease-like transporter